eukprot:m.45041 g.45041  ORF g.45041 m.45041 type:complete len:378 (-) comp15108_c0_seq6:120-1253(-)
MVTMIVLILAALVHVVDSEPGWHVGWGFESHGGFPSNPWASYQMNQSTTAYFVGNASGMDNKAELTAEVHLGYVGIGWQINNIPSNYSHLETYEILEAKRLKELRPDVKVSVLRNTEVATVFWDSARAKMFDPSTQDFWVMCEDGKPCAGTWGSPAGNTVKYWFNFSNPRLVDWWVNEYIGEATNETLFDGVYFDCSCGSPPNIPSADADKFQANAQVAFDRALALIKSKGKWASAWNDDGSITPATCADQMRSWMATGRNSSLSLQILGDAFGPHWNPIKSVTLAQQQNNTIAAFLIARGDSAMLELPVVGAYEDMRSYQWSPMLGWDYGIPIGIPTEVGPGVFLRTWTNAKVVLDCNKYASEIIMRYTKTESSVV